tara:strand:- start:113 stop:304 length:192 start_codon:yes stop_codon:yes gene_type:complete
MQIRDLQIGDLVTNCYKEVGVIIGEWEPEDTSGFYERQYYILHTDGSVVVTSEYDLEVVSSCK